MSPIPTPACTFCSSRARDADAAAAGVKLLYVRRESGLDRLDGILFVLMILSRIEDRRRRRRFAPSLTRSSTRTTSIQAIKAASRSAGDRPLQFKDSRGGQPSGLFVGHSNYANWIPKRIDQRNRNSCPALAQPFRRFSNASLGNFGKQYHFANGLAVRNNITVDPVVPLLRIAMCIGNDRPKDSCRPLGRFFNRLAKLAIQHRNASS